MDLLVFVKTGANTVVVDRLIHKASAFSRDAGSMGAGGFILADPLTLSQPEGQIMSPIL